MKLSLPGMASGWNVDRQNHNYEHHDRIKHDFRDVETPTPPLLYSLLVHDRSPSAVNRPADLHTISVPPNDFAGPLGSRKCSESLPGPPCSAGDPAANVVIAW